MSFPSFGSGFSDGRTRMELYQLRYFLEIARHHRRLSPPASAGRNPRHGRHLDRRHPGTVAIPLAGTKLKRDLAIITRRKVTPSPAAAKFMTLAFKGTAV
ncbi:MAG: hypothetical protein ABIZ56_13250 [Chthoniobacteraceae bacterium]